MEERPNQPIGNQVVVVAVMGMEEMQDKLVMHQTARMAVKVEVAVQRDLVKRVVTVATDM